MVTINTARQQLSAARKALTGVRSSVATQIPNFSAQQLRAPRISRQISAEQARKSAYQSIGQKENELREYELNLDKVEGEAATRQSQYQQALNVYTGRSKGGVQGIPPDILEAASKQAEQLEKNYSSEAYGVTDPTYNPQTGTYDTGLPEDAVPLPQALDTAETLSQFSEINESPQFSMTTQELPPQMQQLPNTYSRTKPNILQRFKAAITNPEKKQILGSQFRDAPVVTQEQFAPTQYQTRSGGTVQVPQDMGRSAPPELYSGNQRVRINLNQQQLGSAFIDKDEYSQLGRGELIESDSVGIGGTAEDMRNAEMIAQAEQYLGREPGTSEIINVQPDIKSSRKAYRQEAVYSVPGIGPAKQYVLDPVFKAVGFKENAISEISAFGGEGVFREDTMPGAFVGPSAEKYWGFNLPYNPRVEKAQYDLDGNIASSTTNKKRTWNPIGMVIPTKTGTVDFGREFWTTPNRATFLDDPLKALEKDVTVIDVFKKAPEVGEAIGELSAPIRYLQKDLFWKAAPGGYDRIKDGYPVITPKEQLERSKKIGRITGEVVEKVGTEFFGTPGRTAASVTLFSTLPLLPQVGRDIFGASVVASELPKAAFDKSLFGLRQEPLDLSTSDRIFSGALAVGGGAELFARGLTTGRAALDPRRAKSTSLADIKRIAAEKGIKIDAVRERNEMQIINKKTNEILLVFDTKEKKWDIPGGARNRGETNRQAAIREAGEELFNIKGKGKTKAEQSRDAYTRSLAKFNKLGEVTKVETEYTLGTDILKGQELTVRQKHNLYQVKVDPYTFDISKLQVQRGEVGGVRWFTPPKNYTGPTMLNPIGQRASTMDAFRLRGDVRGNVVTSEALYLTSKYGRGDWNPNLGRTELIIKQPGEVFFRGPKSDAVFLKKRAPAYSEQSLWQRKVTKPKPGTFQKFQKAPGILVGEGSRYDVPFSAYKQFEGKRIWGTSGTSAPLKGTKVKGALFFQPGSDLTTGYLGISYLKLGLRGASPSYEIGVKKGKTPSIYQLKGDFNPNPKDVWWVKKKKSAPDWVAEQLKEAYGWGGKDTGGVFEPSTKSFTGREFEMVVREGTELKVVGKSKTFLAGKEVKQYQIEVVKDPLKITPKDLIKSKEIKADIVRSQKYWSDVKSYAQKGRRPVRPLEFFRDVASSSRSRIKNSRSFPLGTSSRKSLKPGKEKTFFGVSEQKSSGKKSRPKPYGYEPKSPSPKYGYPSYPSPYAGKYPPYKGPPYKSPPGLAQQSTRTTKELKEKDFFKGANKLKGLFVPELRRRGVFKAVSDKPLVFEKAFEVGKGRALKTLGASFRIREVKTGKIIDLKETPYFRKAKKEQGVLIQTKYSRLGRRAEKKESQAARKSPGEVTWF